MSDASLWAVLAVGAFGGWSAFWAAFWLLLVIGEHNDESAADEEFALAFAASAAIALGGSVLARSLAIRRRVAVSLPTGSWVVGFVGGAMLLGLYLLWAGARQQAE
jgi:hypothetical protein